MVKYKPRIKEKNMSAFDELIRKNGSDNLDTYHKNLVSQKGSLICGSIPEYMDLTSRSRNRVIIDVSSEELANSSTNPDNLGALFIKKGKLSRDYGFVFDIDGTERIIRELISGNELQLTQLSQYLIFENEQKRNLWLSASDATKRRLLSQDLYQLKKKTDMQYRIHGSRLHYLTIGKVTATIVDSSKSEIMTFPLFLFDCQHIDNIKRTAYIEQSGFVNFSLDERYLKSEIQKITNGVSIIADSNLPSKLNLIKSKLEKLELPNVEDIKVDATFSMLGIVTGFETEYLDKTWEKILCEQQ